MFEEKRKKLMLTADDFGKSEGANENILRLAKLGKLDRVSVIVGGDMDGNAVKELLASKVKIDIHFELVWQKRRRNLLKDNAARQGVVFLVNYLWGDWPVPEHSRSGAKAVSREWQSQIEKFKETFGRLPDGISSHEHTHYFPPYLRIALKLAKEFDVPFVRFGGKGFLGSVNMKQAILGSLRLWNKNNFLKSKLDSSDFFTSLDWIGDIEKFLKNIPERETEIACHPERKEEFELIEKYF